MDVAALRRVLEHILRELSHQLSWPSLCSGLDMLYMVLLLWDWEKTQTLPQGGHKLVYFQWEWSGVTCF